MKALTLPRDPNNVPSTGPSNLEISRGSVANVGHNNKFGRAPSGVQTSATDIWDRANATPTQQVYVAPTEARIHAIVSSSTDDVQGGSGAQRVKIYGLKTWTSPESSEIVVMNGAIPVNTVNSYVFINRVKVVENAAGDTYAINVGNITVTAATDSSVSAQINAGKGQTQMAIFGIPSGQTAYMKAYYASVPDAAAFLGSGDSIEIDLLVCERPNINPATFLVKHSGGLASTGSSNLRQPFTPEFKIEGPAIVKIQAVGSAADLDCSAGFDVVIETT